MTVGEDLLLHLAVEQAVLDLVGDDVHGGERRSGFLQVSHREVAHPDGADLALREEALQSIHGLSQGDLLPGIGPVDLVEVDRVHTQSLPAELTRLQHVIVPQVATPHLRGNDHLVAVDLFQGAPHDLLRVAVAVGLRRVEEVHPQFMGSHHGGDTVLVPNVLSPELAPRLPRAQPHPGDLEAAPPQLRAFHDGLATLPP